MQNLNENVIRIYLNKTSFWNRLIIIISIYSNKFKREKSESQIQWIWKLKFSRLTDWQLTRTHQLQRRSIPTGGGTSTTSLKMWMSTQLEQLVNLQLRTRTLQKIRVILQLLLKFRYRITSNYVASQNMFLMQYTNIYQILKHMMRL